MSSTSFARAMFKTVTRVSWLEGRGRRDLSTVQLLWDASKAASRIHVQDLFPLFGIGFSTPFNPRNVLQSHALRWDVAKRTCRAATFNRAHASCQSTWPTGTPFKQARSTDKEVSRAALRWLRLFRLVRGCFNGSGGDVPLPHVSRNRRTGFARKPPAFRSAPVPVSL